MASELAKSIMHPSELASLIHFKFLGGQKKVFPPLDKSELEGPMRRCYELLDKTSRSFSAVIKSLDAELRPAICIFYLVLRGLDTVEDDMSIDLSTKVPLLKCFHEKLEERGWTFDGNSDKEKDKVLMLEFDKVIAEFLKLKPKYREVIKDICKRMGHGMAKFAEMVEVETKEEYYEYCHYVAGLVGIGLSELFSASQLESEEYASTPERSNSMGLFLQKTNIIRDYLEDLVDGRTWYPKEIWSKYGAKLSDFKEPSNREKALECLNDMVTDALQHIPDVFQYLSGLKNQSVFNFCAIPQVMAIATLATCYNNGKVFEGVVKIRKGTAVALMLHATEMNNVYEIFDRHLLEIKAKADERKTPKAFEDAIAKADSELARARENKVYTSVVQPEAGNQFVRLSLFIGVTALVYKLLS